MRLLIVSHTPHYWNGSEIVGWGPTIREIDYLAELFSSIVHVAPLHNDSAPESSMPYSSKNVRFRAVPFAGGDSFSTKLQILKVIPTYLKVLDEEAAKTDAIHVRCPANISLTALFWLMFRTQPLIRWVKYAGNWHPEGREPSSYKLQRYYLARNWHRGVVTVNGSWHNQPSHVQSFYNPCLTEEELMEGREVAASKEIGEPINLLFVGRLEKAKGVDRALRVARVLKERGLKFHFDLLGDGPERSFFERWTEEHNLSNHVKFHGWLPKQDLPRFYSQAHLFLLPTLASEGWPKVLSEAMAYGVVPVTSSISSIPQILRELNVGTALPLDDAAFEEAIQYYIDNPFEWKRQSDRAVSGAQRFTYRNYQKAVSQLFQSGWGKQLAHVPLST